jgi:cytochrome c-type biogenesis protein CcmE
MSSRTKFAVAGLLIVAAVAYLIVSSIGRNVTVSGAVLGDTIVYDSSAPRVTFTIVQVPADPKEVERAGGLATVLHEAVNDPDAPRLEVVYEDVKPDLLQHEAQAILRGQLGEDGRFYADEVLLKCPTRYEEDVPGQVEGP